MTREKFAERWQEQHYPTMDLRAEVPFYYDIFQKNLLRCENTRKSPLVCMAVPI